ncbi:MAG: hypothetical protein Q9166_007288 [cf. Caloplaca sp. 2 TL-2023]
MPHLLALPGEIRNMIYGFVFKPNEAKPSGTHIKPLSTLSTAPDLALLFVSRQIYNEFLAFVYFSNSYVVAVLDSSWLDYVNMLDMTDLIRDLSAVKPCPHFAMAINAMKGFPDPSGDKLYLVFSSQDLDMFVSLLLLVHHDKPLEGMRSAICEGMTIHVRLFKPVKYVLKSFLNEKLLRPFANVTVLDGAKVIDHIFESNFEVIVSLKLFVGLSCLTMHHELRITSGLLHITGNLKFNDIEEVTIRLVTFTLAKYRRLWFELWHNKRLPCHDFGPEWIVKLTCQLYVMHIYHFYARFWAQHYDIGMASYAVDVIMRDWENQEAVGPFAALSDYLLSHLLWVRAVADQQEEDFDRVMEGLEEARELGHPSPLLELGKKWALDEDWDGEFPPIPDVGRAALTKYWTRISRDLLYTFTPQNIDRVFDYPG